MIEDHKNFHFPQQKVHINRLNFRQNLAKPGGGRVLPIRHVCPTRKLAVLSCLGVLPPSEKKKSKIVPLGTILFPVGGTPNRTLRHKKIYRCKQLINEGGLPPK